MIVSIDDVRIFARKMVERESRGNGDQINAMDRVARRCGMNSRALHRVITGETKDPGIRVYGAIRKAFIEQMARQVLELQSELDVERAKDAASDLNIIDQELEALAARLRLVRERKEVTK